MSCFYPRTVWRSKKRLNDSGAMKTMFKRPNHMFFKFPAPHDPSQCSKAIIPYDFYSPEEFQIPGCKPKCVGCIEDYSRSRAVRAWHETLMVEDDKSCFITLTFNDKFCPRQLDHRYFQLFIKRLRKYLSKSGQAKRVRYFMSGEYGSLNFRPHFHSLLFGYDFPDRVLFSVSNGVNLYISDILSTLWSDPKTDESYGFSSVGDASFESAAYIARYVGKKIGRDVGYEGLEPEYSKCSLKPGLGKTFFDKFKASVFSDDAVTLQGGGKCKPPRYYDKLLQLTDQVLFDKLKLVRKMRAKLSPDNSPERLKAREAVKTAQFKQLVRSL